LSPTVSLFLIGSLSILIWVVALIAVARVVWWAWIGPRRLDAIEHRLAALTNAVEALSVSLERHIDQR
jgi:hypothetical protein